jgi:hypothetical protein
VEVGNGAYVEIPDSPTLHFSQQMTVSCWVKPTAYRDNWQDYVSKLDATNYPNWSGWCVRSAGANAGYSTYFSLSTSSEGPNTTASSFVPQIGKWEFVVVTYDGENVKTYADGNLVATVPRSGKIVNGIVPITIGGANYTGDYYFTGSIDDVRLYNRALCPAEISDLSTELPTANRAVVSPDSLPPAPNLPVTITIGNSGVGRDVSDIDPATIRINGTLSPTLVGVEAGHSGFTGSVLGCVTTVRDLRTTYADRSASGLQLVISGAYRDGISFTVQAPVKFYEIWIGDVNGDGFVDGKDVTALASYLKTGKPEPVSIDNADVNRDGKINLSDLSALVSLIAGTRAASNTF